MSRSCNPLTVKFTKNLLPSQNGYAIDFCFSTVENGVKIDRPGKALAEIRDIFVTFIIFLGHIVSIVYTFGCSKINKLSNYNLLVRWAHSTLNQ